MSSSSLFELPKRIQQLLCHYDGTWMIAGGWAIDLFLQQPTRIHKDIEIAIPRSEQLQLRNYLSQRDDWIFRYAQSGRLIDWQAEHLLQLPIHEIHAERSDGMHLEILLNEINEHQQWVFRRSPQVVYPIQKMCLSSVLSIPILCPEIVLLYKAKINQPKDQMDLNNTLPHLDLQQLYWLSTAIATTHGQSHQWIKIIENTING